MKLGIFGGTFDPIHVGHLRLAIEAKEALGLDEVVLEVAGKSPFKLDTTTTPSEIRHLMVVAAIEGSPSLTAGRVELDREGISYTVDTAATYAREGRSLWIVVGADALAGLTEWMDPDRLLSMCRVAVGFRMGHEIHRIFDSMPKKWQSRIDLFPAPTLEISSTEIRKRVSEGRSIEFWTPESVVRIVEQYRLYE
ncbi:MAG TPA: nicotinate-nucleotide adenylyltransferase [Fimbriimonadales bacterium]|jgi:nicotinate-nucleotide adenylyltransferase|nr:nicotinate-nucleotide adenylyltransferase [Fimbriimonadales bacterium]